MAIIGASRDAVLLAARMSREAVKAGSRPCTSLADAHAAPGLGDVLQAA